jgi:hypothetical protein
VRARARWACPMRKGGTQEKTGTVTSNCPQICSPSWLWPELRSWFWSYSWPWLWLGTVTCNCPRLSLDLGVGYSGGLGFVGWRAWLCWGTVTCNCPRLSFRLGFGGQLLVTVPVLAFGWLFGWGKIQKKKRGQLQVTVPKSGPQIGSPNRVPISGRHLGPSPVRPVLNPVPAEIDGGGRPVVRWNGRIPSRRPP